MTVPVATVGPRPWARYGGPVLVLVATAVMGFLLVGQLRGTERFRQRLEAESEGDLTRILASLTTEANALAEEVSNLKLQLLRLETSNVRDAATTAAADEQLRALQVLAGTVAVSGPGVSVTVDDPDGAVSYDVLIDVVQELRDAGAEAVSVNGRRVGVASAFAERDDLPTLDGEVLRTPIRLDAIGQATTLEGALEIPGGALDTLRSLRGVEVHVERAAKLELPALERPPSFRAARPVTSQR